MCKIIFIVTSIVAFFVSFNIECFQNNLNQYQCIYPYSELFDNYFCYKFKDVNNDTITIFSYKDSCSLQDRYDTVLLDRTYYLNVRKATIAEQEKIFSTLSMDQIPITFDRERVKPGKRIIAYKKDYIPLYVCNNLCGQRCTIRH